jgi:hypothetical protein
MGSYQKRAVKEQNRVAIRNTALGNCGWKRWVAIM